jgi:hypothetical protein
MLPAARLAGTVRTGCGNRQTSPQRRTDPWTVYAPPAGALGAMVNFRRGVDRVQWCAKTRAQVLLRSHEFAALRHRWATNGGQSAGRIAEPG